MIIDIKDIQGYTFCPVSQKLRDLEIFTPFISLTEKYENDIHKFAFGYNTTLMNNGKINIEETKTIFGSLWLGTKKADDFIIMDTGSTRNTYSKYRKKGTDNIIDFHEYNLKNQYRPISVNYRYKVPITNNLFLTGNIDLIKEIDNKIIVTNFISKSDLACNKNNDLETIAMVYAFRYIFDTKEDETSMYIFDKKKEINIEINDDAISRFKINVMNIAKAIHNNLYYFATSDNCIKCPYKDICRDSKQITKILKEST